MTRALFGEPHISGGFATAEPIALHCGDALDFLKTLPNGLVSLIVTSPPYNLGKKYERRRALSVYLEGQAKVIDELIRVLRDDGSICWEVGNYVEEGEVFPLDVFFYDLFKDRGLKLRIRMRGGLCS